MGVVEIDIFLKFITEAYAGAGFSGTHLPYERQKL